MDLPPADLTRVVALQRVLHEAAWSEDLHPRAGKGPGGGRFVVKERKDEPQAAPAPTPETLAKAQRQYDALWSEAASYFGADAFAPPSVTWLQPDDPLPPNIPADATAYMSRGPNGMRSIFVLPATVSALGDPASSRAQRLYAKETLIHEWAHIYQSEELLTHENPDFREIAANKFAAEIGRAVLPKGFRDSFYGNRGAMTKLNAAFGPGYWKQAQFGANYGTDPTTIPWPRANRSRGSGPIDPVV